MFVGYAGANEEQVRELRSALEAEFGSVVDQVPYDQFRVEGLLTKYEQHLHRKVAALQAVIAQEERRISHLEDIVGHLFLEESRWWVENRTREGNERIAALRARIREIESWSTDTAIIYQPAAGDTELSILIRLPSEMKIEYCGVHSPLWDAIEVIRVAGIDVWTLQ